MEYPGYGFYTHEIRGGKRTTKRLTCSAQVLKENSILIYKYVTSSIEDGGLGFKEEDVVLFGRSIGTGPASMLASMFNPSALIIVSPYLSI